MISQFVLDLKIYQANHRPSSFFFSRLTLGTRWHLSPGSKLFPKRSHCIDVHPSVKQIYILIWNCSAIFFSDFSVFLYICAPFFLTEVRTPRRALRYSFLHILRSFHSLNMCDCSTP